MADSSTTCGGCYGAAYIEEQVIDDGAATPSGLTVGATLFAFATPDLVTILPIPQTTTFNPASVSRLSFTSPYVYLIVSSYSVISTTLNRGTCVPSAGPGVLTGPFSYIAGPLSNVPLTGFNPPITSIAQSFAQRIGLTCDNSGSNVSTVTPIDVLASSSRAVVPSVEASTTTVNNGTTSASTFPPSSGAGPPTATATGSTASITTSPGLNSGTKVGIGLGIPLGLLIITMFVLLFRRRERKRAVAAPSPENPNDKRRRRWRAYFQDKGELDAEEQRRNELENSEIRHELEPRERHELAVEERRQELKGDDHVQELG